ncbi:helix-turn-helix domain-containing protein [Pseudoflavitalea rhizosphaerae]|uniref:helix-turn-helix domain-containing protein n=1 Tax=Pseudoflavitalea rhizosphaerae TaxID=1884793 RepID=UPI000F8CE20A|nr:helix-turn-helix domain-containing protein [Pseudoflavitalea rhizosphaerae]
MRNKGKILANPEKYIYRDQLVTLGDLEEFKIDLMLSLKNLLLDKNSQASKKWLKTYEVRKLLNVSAGTLQTLRNNGTIPFSRIGGILYYDPEEINKVIELLKQRRA